MLNQKAKIIEPKGIKLRDPEDFQSLREDIYEDARIAMEKSFPQKYGNIVMRVRDLHYQDPPTFTKKYEKEAISKDLYLGRKLKGTVQLYDKEGALLDEKQTTLMRVPYLTDRGTFIHGGNDYGSLMQSRLIPGVYTRRQENGSLETQVNTRPGTGSSFRVGLESDTGQYSLKVRSSNIHLYSLLKDMGVPDEEMRKNWGDELFKMNAANYDPSALDRAYERAVPKFQKTLAGENPDKRKLLNDFFEKAQVHERVTRMNLPGKFDMEKQAAFIGKELSESLLPEFKPDLSPSDALDAYVVRNPAVVELVKEASSGDVVPQHLKWIGWYAHTSAGNTTPFDAEYTKMWKKAAAHFNGLDRDPEIVLSARTWGIDLTKDMSSTDRSDIVLDIQEMLVAEEALTTLQKESSHVGSNFAEIFNTLID